MIPTCCAASLATDMPASAAHSIPTFRLQALQPIKQVSAVIRRRSARARPHSLVSELDQSPLWPCETGIATVELCLRSLQEWEEPLESRRRTAQTFQRYATLSAATHRLLEPDLSEQRRNEVLSGL